MNDPERLSIASDSDLERLLLRSARAPAPLASRNRALVAATAALGVSALTVGSAAAGGAAAKTGSVLSLKWLAAIGIAGLGAMTAAAAVYDHHVSSEPSHRLDGPANAVVTAQSPSAPRIVPGTSPQPTASIDDTASGPQAPPAPSPAAARAPAVGHEPTASSESSVHAELATLEQARGALSAGEPARALSILDTYTASYPRGAMGPEATMLRIEALVRAGDRPAAERVGNAFLASQPQSPYAARIRSLIGGSKP